MRRIGLFPSADVLDAKRAADAGRADRRRRARAFAGRGTQTRVKIVTIGVEQPVAERRLNLTLQAIDDRRTWDVADHLLPWRADAADRGSEGELVALVAGVEASELAAHVTIEEGRFPADLVVGEVFGQERRERRGVRPKRHRRGVD